ncbi:hypothetical protein V1514DRAFT_334645 [Lipomyces japonicus]|uniref:uncharacterized protein n=1 Tax=Lipomyces japonicus TaxID=56871 RepID=UPI0034CD2E1E
MISSLYVRHLARTYHDFALQWRRWPSLNSSGFREVFKRKISTTPLPKKVATVSTETASISSTEKLNVFLRFGQAYKEFHTKRPYTTQALQALLISFVGDSLSQLLITPDVTYSPLRTLKVMLTGSVLSIPTFEWVRFMSKNINHSNKYLSLALKCICNQLCFAPFFLSSFLTIGLVSQGIFSSSELFDNLKQRLPTAWVNGCMYWPNVVILNFTVIPPHCRGLVNSFASMIWQAYLSFLTFSSKESVIHSIEREFEAEHKIENLVLNKLHDSEVALLKAEKNVVERIYKPARSQQVSDDQDSTPSTA